MGRSVVKLLTQEASDFFELTHIFNRNVERKKVDWVPVSVRWTETSTICLPPTRIFLSNWPEASSRPAIGFARPCVRASRW